MAGGGHLGQVMNRNPWSFAAVATTQPPLSHCADAMNSTADRPPTCNSSSASSVIARAPPPPPTLAETSAAGNNSIYPPPAGLHWLRPAETDAAEPQTPTDWYYHRVYYQQQQQYGAAESMFSPSDYSAAPYFFPPTIYPPHQAFGTELEYAQASVQPTHSLTNYLSPLHMPSQQNAYGHQFRMMTAAKRTKGGRRPKEEDQEMTYGMSEEEREKRMKRRLRNKEAAARCRKRRLDVMTRLEMEVKELQAVNQSKDIRLAQLQKEKEELERVLRSHRCLRADAGETALGMAGATHAKLVAKRPRLLNKVKSENAREPTLTEASLKHDLSDPLRRPTTLAFDYGGDGKSNETAGVVISTPSNVLGFPFGDYISQSTGLTPYNCTSGVTHLFPVTTSTLETPMDCCPTTNLEKL